MSERIVTDATPSRATRWLSEHAVPLLKEVGVKAGQRVLDFGCGEGTYTIPAAIILSDGGIVYAVDQDKGKLEALQAKFTSMGLRNIRTITAADRANIELPDESIDVILLYDVLHSWYHPRSEQRKEILRELHRVLRLDGLLSFYPGDPEVFNHRAELAAIQREIREADFRLQGECTTMLVHEGSLVEGHIFSFAKRSKSDHA